jgi:hypothetical protein
MVIDATALMRVDGKDTTALMRVVGNRYYSSDEGGW